MRIVIFSTGVSKFLVLARGTKEDPIIIRNTDTASRLVIHYRRIHTKGYIFHYNIELPHLLDECICCCLTYKVPFKIWDKQGNEVYAWQPSKICNDEFSNIRSEIIHQRLDVDERAYKCRMWGY